MTAHMTWMLEDCEIALTEWIVRQHCSTWQHCGTWQHSGGVPLDIRLRIPVFVISG